MKPASKFAPSRSAPIRFVLMRFAAIRSVQLRSASQRSAEKNCALERHEPLKLVPFSIEKAKSALEIHSS